VTACCRIAKTRTALSGHSSTKRNWTQIAVVRSRGKPPPTPPPLVSLPFHRLAIPLETAPVGVNRADERIEFLTTGQFCQQAVETNSAVSLAGKCVYEGVTSQFYCRNYPFNIGLRAGWYPTRRSPVQSSIYNVGLEDATAARQTDRRPSRSRRMTAVRVITSVAASSSLVDRAEWLSGDSARVPGRYADDRRHYAHPRRRAWMDNEGAKIAIVRKWIQSHHLWFLWRSVISVDVRVGMLWYLELVLCNWRNMRVQCRDGPSIFQCFIKCNVPLILSYANWNSVFNEYIKVNEKYKHYFKAVGWVQCLVLGSRRSHNLLATSRKPVTHTRSDDFNATDAIWLSMGCEVRSWMHQPLRWLTMYVIVKIPACIGN